MWHMTILISINKEKTQFWHRFLNMLSYSRQVKQQKAEHVTFNECNVSWKWFVPCIFFPFTMSPLIKIYLEQNGVKLCLTDKWLFVKYEIWKYCLLTYGLQIFKNQSQSDMWFINVAGCMWQAAVFGDGSCVGVGEAHVKICMWRHCNGVRDSSWFGGMTGNPESLLVPNDY